MPLPLKSLVLEGRELTYQERGDSETVLLLVHGFPLDHQMWQFQVDAFAEQYRVIAPDLPGFGQSGLVGPQAHAMSQYADTLALLLSRLRIPRVIYCGLSMGGYIGWQFYFRYQPLVERLIICDSRAIADSPDAAAGREATAQRVLQQGSGVVADQMLSKLFAPETLASGAEYVQRTAEVMRETPPEAVAAALRGMAQRRDVTRQLAEITCPSLLLGGEHDVISPPDEMQGIADAMPRASFVPIPRAGHMAPLENPQTVNQAIAAFLAE